MKNKSVFKGWFENDGWRVNKTSSGIYAVYHLTYDGSAYQLLGTVRARGYIDAIRKVDT